MIAIFAILDFLTISIQRQLDFVLTVRGIAIGVLIIFVTYTRLCHKHFEKYHQLVVSIMSLFVTLSLMSITIIVEDMYSPNTILGN